MTVPQMVIISQLIKSFNIVFYSILRILILSDLSMRSYICLFSSGIDQSATNPTSILPTIYICGLILRALTGIASSSGACLREFEAGQHSYDDTYQQPTSEIYEMW
jgi:hypothetical protein